MISFPNKKCSEYYMFTGNKEVVKNAGKLSLLSDMYLFDHYLRYFKHYGNFNNSKMGLDSFYYDQKVISFFPSDFESGFA